MRQQNTYLRYFVWFLALLPLWVVSTANGQEPETVTWNWAWDRDTHTLYAYSQDGEVSTLLTTDMNDTFWRINERMAVALIQNADNPEMYLLDGPSFTRITIDFDIEVITQLIDLRMGFKPIAYHDPFLVLTSWSAIGDPLRMPGILVDLATREALLLSDLIVSGAVRFSEDGTLLRYVHIEGTEDNRTWELRERSLLTSNERTLYNVSGDLSIIDSDTFGNRWLVRELDRDNQKLQYQIYDVTTNSEKTIYTRNPDDYYISYGFRGNDLVWHTPLCSSYCFLTIETDTGRVTRYPLEDQPGGQSISLLYKSRNDILTIQGMYSVWHLFPDDPAMYIGAHYRGGSHLPSVISPGGRYILMADQEQYPPNERMMVDLETQQIILDIPDETENPLSMTYDQEGFIVNTRNKGPRWLYLYASQEFIELPDIGYGYYFDVLPDGTVLYGIGESIYQYNTITKRTTLLIENIDGISINDARLLDMSTP